MQTISSPSAIVVSSFEAVAGPRVYDDFFLFINIFFNLTD